MTQSQAYPSTPEAIDLAVTTPLMAQYLELKQKHPDELLLFRLGDFYELFFDDAKKASDILGLVLTKRGQLQGQDIPMCGIPAHALDGYLAQLIQNQQRVAICEQMESPDEAKKRGHKAIVKRSVVRVVSPGTLTEETLLPNKQHNFLLSLSKSNHQFGICWGDISTGDVFTQISGSNQLYAVFERVQPNEILAPDSVLQTPELFELFQQWKGKITRLADHFTRTSNLDKRIQDYYGVQTLEGMGPQNTLEWQAFVTFLDYVTLSGQGKAAKLQIPKHFDTQQEVFIDASTRKNLELMRTLQGEWKGSLSSVLDQTLTGVGGRLLIQEINQPVHDITTLTARLDAVDYAFQHEEICGELREILVNFPDMERAMARLFLGRGVPRDLEAIRQGLHIAQQLMVHLKIHQEDFSDFNTPTNDPNWSDVIDKLLAPFDFPSSLYGKLQESLNDQMPAYFEDGGVIAEGYSKTLDQQRSLYQKAQQHLDALEQRYREWTNISNLKIKHNNILGHFVEITPSHASKLKEEPFVSYFIHRQGLTTGLRVTSIELQKLEHDILNARAEALKHETQLIQEIIQIIQDDAASLKSICHAVAILDVRLANAHWAKQSQYVRPCFVDDPILLIQGGRHPVVEWVNRQHHQEFVPNDCRIHGYPDETLWLITGPNMSGKSTFLRQTALIVLMAHTGCFVPAAKVTLGPVDKIFCRVGAADDLARGKSTFMVEMIETATILNQATERSMVILDEVGRGTATYDGLAIAWACLEHLLDHLHCRCLFATHYHELTSIAKNRPSMKCMTTQIQEWDDKIVFLHRLIEGTAQRSYGIHVAKLAGVPESVIHRAKIILKSLEKGSPIKPKHIHDPSQISMLLPLSAPMPPSAPPLNTPPLPLLDKKVYDEIARVDPNQMSPRDALDWVYQLCALARPTQPQQDPSQQETSKQNNGSRRDDDQKIKPIWGRS